MHDIKRRLWSSFLNFDYKLFNVFVFKFESDFLAISKSGYVWEIEIKTSKGDFKKDFKKADNRQKKHDWLIDNSKVLKPNKFCFAVPAGMILDKDIPEYAGLIYVYKNGTVEIIKHPKFLHKEKLLEDKLFLRKMLDKFYFQHTDMKRVLNLREWDLKYKQQRINL